MIVYDLKLTADEDLYIDPIMMDFVIAPSDQQHIKDILLSVPGWFKEFPLVGWNPYKRLNARGSKQENIQSAKDQLSADGYLVNPGDLDFDLTPDGELIFKTLNVTRP